jgi:hypothetical protein
VSTAVARELNDGAAALWRGVDKLLEHARVESILAHKLGPLAAHRLRQSEVAVPPELEAEERAAALANAVVLPLLQRIRSACDGPLILFKGPEVAPLYPGRARRFVDVDLLAADAPGVHAALIAHGFVDAAADPDDFYPGHVHLRELKWPTIWLKVEVHERTHWPAGAAGTPVSTLLDAAVPSQTGIEGVSALAPEHHALVLATHAWVHEPLATLRDLVDVAAVAAGLDGSEVARTAQRWGIGRLWATTARAIDGLFDNGAKTLPLRTWARHLPRTRERTVLENHLGRWLHAYWEARPAEATRRLGRALVDDVRPAAGERGRDKLLRISRALRDPGAGTGAR